MLRSPERLLTRILKRSQLDVRTWALWGTLLALFLWAYWPTLTWIVATWRSDPDYTHGLLVLPIAWVIWRRRAPAEPPTLCPSMGGLTLIGLAAALRYVAARYYLLPLDAWSTIVWLGGVVWTFGGWQVFRCALPSLAFLWFAAPLPDRVEALLSLPLQRQAAAATAWVLQCMREPAVASGTTILLGAQKFEVEHACSGLRMFFGTFALASAFVLLGARDRVTNLAILIMAAPVAVFANVVRIVFTAYLYQHASTDLLRRFIHDLAGLLMIGLVVGSYALLLLLLRWGIRSHQTNRDRFVRLLPTWPMLVVALALLAVMWHGRQAQRALTSLLDAADSLERQRQWSEASDYLDRYLQFRPDDTQALRRLARAVHRSAQHVSQRQRALTLLTAACNANPEDLELAGELAELAWGLRHHEQVIATTTAILRHGEVDRPELAALRQTAARLRAQAMYDALSNTDRYTALGWTDVSEALADAMRWDPLNAQHAFRLAIVYRERLSSPGQAERIRLADELMDSLVRNRPDLAEAWLVRYRYRRRFQLGQDAPLSAWAEIDHDLAHAKELNEQRARRNVHIIVAVAERLRERGDVDASLAQFRLALEANPRDVRPYLAISEIWVERGTVPAREQAVDVLQQGLALLGPDELPLLFPLIEQLVVLDRNEQVEQYVAQAERSLRRQPEPARSSYRIQLQQVESWRLAKQGGYAAAASQLEQLLSELPAKYTQASRTYAAQAWATAGQYHRMAGDWNQAAAAYRQAAALDEVWRLEYRWALARETELRGDLGQAAKRYGELARVADEAPEAWIQAATVALRQQVLLHPSTRDWTQFRLAITAARHAAQGQPARLVVLEANQLMLVDQPERAARLLVEALKDDPRSPLLYRSLALWQLRRGDPSGALQTARQMSPLAGTPLDSALLQKELLCAADRHEEAIELLRATLAAAGGDADVVTAQLELAWLYLQQARWGEARQCLDEAATRAPDDLRVTEALSELAWCRQDWSLLEQCESALREVEGTYGPLWRSLRLGRLLAQSPEIVDPETDSPTDSPAESSADPSADPPADPSADPTIGSSNGPDEIDDLARQLERFYPGLQQTRIVAGRVAAYRGETRRAVANYEEAWELGLPRVSLAVDLVGLLNELGETDRAQRYVREVRHFLSATSSVIDQSFLDLETESVDETIRMAGAMVEEMPSSESYLRLGRTLVLTALPEQRDYEPRLQRAEAAFRRAVEIDPTDTRAWAALFRYLVAVQPNPVESQAVLASLAEHRGISPLERSYVLAQLNESINNGARAAELYRESLELAEQQAVPKKRLVVLERAAQFFRQVDAELAEHCCRQALELDDKAVGPRQILIELLLAKQSGEAALEAKRLAQPLELLGIGGDSGRRLVARVLLEALPWDGEADVSRQRAIDLLDGLTNKTSSDTLLMAELHLLGNRQAEAISELRSLLEDLPTDGAELLRFLRKFDRQLDATTPLRILAERLYQQLESLPPFDLPALDQRLTLAEQRTAGSTDSRPPLAASLIDSFARRAIARTASDQEQFQELVRLMQYLLASGRWEEVERLTHLEPELLARPRPAAALATALALADPAQAPLPPVADSLDGWLNDYPDDAELLFAVANLRFMRGDNAGAIRLFRRSLTVRPHEATTLNNLALALASEDPASLDESLRLIDQAIELDGRTVQSLDSLAVLHLINGERDTAVALLLEALSQAPADGLLFLHLAKGWLEQGDEKMARFALSMTESMNTRDQALLPMDQQMYQQLVSQLGVPGR